MIDYNDILLDVNFIGGAGKALLYDNGDSRSDVDLVSGKYKIYFYDLKNAGELSSLTYYNGNSFPNSNQTADGNPALNTEQSSILQTVLNSTMADHYSVSFADVANVEFNYGSTTNAHIIVGQYSETNQSAVANTYTNNLTNNIGSIAPLQHGDIWINDNYRLGWNETAEGTAQNLTLIHELGHALGLAHPPLNDLIDNQKYTMMSYKPLVGMENFDVQFDPTSDTVTPFGLQLLDIAAIQAIYGSNTTTRVENDTQYSKVTAFASTRPNEAFIYTVFDAGGYRDTIDARGFDDTINEGGNFDGNFGVEINLNQGAFSSIGKAADSEFSGIRGKGNAIDNVAIAYGTEIENAYGTVGDDTLIGNSGNNKLYGGAGADTFISSTGIDSIYGEDGIDTLSYKDESEYVVVVYTAGDRGAVYKADSADNLQQRDNFFTMEHIEGSAYNDEFILKGSATPDKAFGLAGDDHFFLKADVTQSVYLDGGLGQDSVYIDGLDSTDFTQTVGATTIYTNIADPQLTLEFKDIEDVHFGGTDITYAGSVVGQSGYLNLGKSSYAADASRYVNADMSDSGDFSTSASRTALYANGSLEASLSSASIYWDFEKFDPENNPTNSSVDSSVGGTASFADQVTIQAPTQGGTGYTEFSFSLDIESSGHNGYITHYFNIVDTVQTGAAGNLQQELFGQWYDVPTFDTLSNAGNYPSRNVPSGLVEKYRFSGDEITFNFFLATKLTAGLPTRNSGDIYAGYGKIDVDLILASGSTMQSQSGVFDTQTRVYDVQEWQGSANGDVFVGSGFDENLYGLVGDDDIEGKDGIDRLYGGDGNDTLKGGNGADFLYGENDNDILNGGDGNDYLYGHLGNDTLDGGLGVDTLYGNEGLDILNGNEGADKLLGGSEDDTLNGGDGNDKLYGEGGSDTLNGDAGTDTLYGGDDNDILIGGTGTDFLYGQGGADIFTLDLTSIDRLSDFDASEGDTINIADLLIGYDSATDDINDFVTLVYRNTGRTDIRVNDDGIGNDLPYVGIVFSDLTGETVNTLVASGALIVE